MAPSRTNSMIVKKSSAVALCLLLGACGTAGLDSLVLDGHELHASLETLRVEELPLHVPHSELPDNPHHSTDASFVEAVARGSSQGKLNGEGIRAALYAVYRGQSQVGVYGLEAGSVEEADRRESTMRGIWAMNASLDRARVHRGEKILVVVWNHPETPSCWEAVNAVVARRLGIDPASAPDPSVARARNRLPETRAPR